jgi:hypothetical protein
MNDCLFCGQEVEQKEGKKPRLFCDGNCRNKHYYRLKAAKREKKPIGRPKSKIGDLVFEGPKVKFKKNKAGKFSLADYKEATESSYDGVKNPFPVSDEVSHFVTPDPAIQFHQTQIEMHQKEYDSIPDKTKGLGKLRAAFLLKQINILKNKLK